MGGVPITTIVGQHGTPMYVYEGDMLCSRYEALRGAFPSFEIFYSMKANPSLALVGLLRRLGAGSEIASGGELFLTKEVGHDPLDVVFAGPGKTDEENAATSKSLNGIIWNVIKTSADDSHQVSCKL